MPKIRFPDKTAIEAPTWEEVEEELQSAQWVEYPDNKSFREDMARRAMVWSEEEIEIDGDSHDFMWELSRAQLLDIVPDLGVLRGGREEQTKV